MQQTASPVEWSGSAAWPTCIPQLLAEFRSNRPSMLPFRYLRDSRSRKKGLAEFRSTAKPLNSMYSCVCVSTTANMRLFQALARDRDNIPSANMFDPMCWRASRPRLFVIWRSTGRCTGFASTTSHRPSKNILDYREYGESLEHNRIKRHLSTEGAFQ